jgi:ankyrin repeat protein
VGNSGLLTRERSRHILQGCSWQQCAGCYYSGKAETIEELLRRGASLSERNLRHETPLHLAARHREWKLLGYDFRSKVYSYTESISREIAKLLIKSGADVNAINDDGNSPLHLAAHHSREEVLTLLVENHAQLSAENKTGETAAFIAFGRGSCVPASLTTFCEIVRAGGKLRRTSDRGEVLYDEHKVLTKVASCERQGETYDEPINLLISCYKNLNGQDEDGWTVLHWVVFHDQVEIVRQLLEKGANVNLKAKKRRIPLHLAVMGQFTDTTSKKELIVALLLKYDANKRAKDLGSDGLRKMPLERMPWWRAGDGIRREFAQAK